MDQGATWYGGRPQHRPHCVRWGSSSPFPKKGRSSPLFGPCLLWPNQTVEWIKVPLGTKVDLIPGHVVLHADPAFPIHKGHNPQFSAHVCCAQMVAHLSYCWALVPLPCDVWFTLLKIVAKQLLMRMRSHDILLRYLALPKLLLPPIPICPAWFMSHTSYRESAKINNIALMQYDVTLLPETVFVYG